MKLVLILRIMTFNIHHGEGVDGKVDLDRIAALIKKDGADIVALQEVDRTVPRSGGADIASRLASLTGLNAVFAPNIDLDGGQYGNAILTRYPVKSHENVRYRVNTAGEQRGLERAVLDVEGRELTVLNTHLDWRPDPFDRHAHVDQLLALHGSAGGAAILAGDFNDVPRSATHRKLTASFDDCWDKVGSGDGRTEDERRIDWVLVRKGGDLECARSWTTATVASDHRAVTTELRWR